MAAIIGTFLSASDYVYGFSNSSLTSELNSLSAAEFNPTTYDGPLYKPVTIYTSKISESGAHWAISGNIQQSYFTDFYNQIHTSQRTIDLGNVLSSKSVQVEVWSAFLDTNNLYQIIHTGADDGLTIVEPVVAPTTYRPLQSLTYTINVGLKGSYKIDSNFLFDFQFGSGLLFVIGSRMAIWPYKPLDSMKEQLEWNTDIIKTFDSEQRIAIRSAPRTVYNIENYMDAKDFSIAKSLAKAFSNLVFSLPSWFDAIKVPNISAGSVVINVSTVNADYRVGSNAIILKNKDEYEPVEIIAKTNSSITAKTPISKAYTDALVMPMRTVRALGGLTFKRQPGEITFASVDFTSTDDIDLSANSATIDYPMYDGLYVLTQDIIATSSISDKISKSVDVFDNGQGLIEVADTKAFTDRKSSATFDSTTRYSRWQLIKFLHTVKGRRGSFWVPTFNTDMRLYSNISQGHNKFDIHYLKYHLYSDESDIVISLLDGSLIFNHVLGSDSFGTYEQLTVRDAWPISINMSNVRRISYLHKSRFDSDSITLEHSLPETVQVNASIVEIPE